MSLITRCPACQTMFKVVPDQLRISEGWVRCGQCDEIFDASIHLLQVVPEEVRPLVPVDEPAQDADAVDLSNIIFPTDTAVDVVDAPTENPHLSADEWMVEPDESPIEALNNAQEALPIEFEAQEDPLAVLPDEIMHFVQADRLVLESEAEQPAESEEVSFLRGQNKKGFWRQSLVRAILLILSVLLLSGLVGQVVFQERDRLVALEPSLTPVLQAFCRSVNCSLSPLQRIESIVIENSSFTKIRGDSYALSFTLKNSAATPLAFPAIELTLTDSVDQAVVRRIFQPSELNVKSGVLAAGAEWSTQFSMVVNGSAVADKVVGYRLLAFYP